MKTVLAVVLLLLGALNPFSVGAESNFVDGNTLYNDCNEPLSDPGYSYCTGYVAGISDLLATLMDLKAIPRKICLPHNVSLGQLRDIVVKDFKDNPNKRHYTASSSIYVALANAFPCNN
jgi:hypothetical protein